MFSAQHGAAPNSQIYLSGDCLRQLDIGAGFGFLDEVEEYAAAQLGDVVVEEGRLAIRILPLFPHQHDANHYSHQDNSQNYRRVCPVDTMVSCWWTRLCLRRRRWS